MPDRRPLVVVIADMLAPYLGGGRSAELSYAIVAALNAEGYMIVASCTVCGTPADLDDDGLCEDCAVDGWGDDEPVRPMEDVPVQGGLL